jgi:hypothetical protein
MSDLVNHPKHYTQHKSGVECIEITEHLMCNRANAIKYAWRANDKGCTREDLQKCEWYINREIKRLQRGNNVPDYSYDLDVVYTRLYDYYKDYEFDKRLFDFISNLIHGGEERLAYALKIVDSWVRELEQ